MTPVSVILPVSTDAHGLPTAAACILNQSHSHLELLIVLNGADEATRLAAETLLAADRRVRLESISARGLTAALNHGLHTASHELIARMDSDDRCEPTRIAAQVSAFEDDPGIDAIGTAWRMESANGECLALMRPPQQPLAAWWMLLAQNPFAHGSMMFRQSSVMGAGGYDPTFSRAQDFDLWLRLSSRGGVKAIADVLYTHTVRSTGTFSSSPEQAACSARALANAWARLPTQSSLAPKLMAEALASPITADTSDALIARLENEAPTSTGLCTKAWIKSFFDHRHQAIADPGATLRRLAHLRDKGVDRAWLWGAGAHSERLMPVLKHVGITVLGLIDDALAGTTRLNYRVQPPNVLVEGDHAIVSSDAHEEAIWRSSASCRARGVVVHRLSADEHTEIIS